MRRLGFVLLMAGLSLNPVAGRAASLIGLGTLQTPGTYNFFSTYPRDISSDGSTVVGLSRSDESYDDAFVWNETNGMRSVGDLPGRGYRVEALGVSGDGTVVVGMGSSELGNEAFIWDEVDQIRGLGDLPGGNHFSAAHDVSADGSTVVGFGSRLGFREGFVWTSTTGMRGIGDLPGGQHTSSANGVSANGEVVVGRSWSTSGPEAFIWDEINGMRGLGDLPGGSFNSEALAISSDGSTVVGISRSSTTPDSSQGYEAFIWDVGSGMRGLGRLPGGAVYSSAYGVSGDGSVVVGTTGAADYPRAFIWDSEHGMRDLGTVLQSLGVDTSGWHLYEARAISGDGLRILGYGGDPAGNGVAFIADLTPIPEPSTTLLMLMGLAGLSRRRLSPGRRTVSKA